MQLNPSHVYGGVVDRLAQVKAQIAELQAEETTLKAELAATGEPVIEGMYHRASISSCDGKVVIDWRAIAEHFNPSRQLVTAHTSQGEAYVTVRVSARKTS